MIGRIFLLLFFILVVLPVAGCGTARDPQIITKEVKVAVPTPCTPELGQRPKLMTFDEIKAALAAAPNSDAKTKIITEQLLLYVGWMPKVEAGLKGCGGTESGTR